MQILGVIVTMVKYEYLVKQYAGSTVYITEELNTVGNHGWELISSPTYMGVRGSWDTFMFVFKRPISVEPKNDN